MYELTRGNAKDGPQVLLELLASLYTHMRGICTYFRLEYGRRPKDYIITAQFYCPVLSLNGTTMGLSRMELLES
jgi:hypothetical protein